MCFREGLCEFVKNFISLQYSFQRMVSSVIFLLPLAVAVFWIVRIFLLKDLNKVQFFIIAGMTVAVLTMFYRKRTALFMFPFFYLAVRQKISEFINSLRIEYFTKTVQADGGEASIKDAALRSGYNNLQSFYRHFSEIMEMTPKAWISKQSK